MARRVNFGFAVSKVDEEQRLVIGRATDASLDRQNDIVPYPVALAAFESASVVGVNEMHTGSPVGRLEWFQGDEAEQAIDIAVYLSESTDGENALIKAREGVLTGFSIEGRAQSHREAGANVYDKLELIRIALVDVPANPNSTINVVKFEG